MSKTVIVCGPDGTGKTEISKALASELRVPYFKVSTERANWQNNTFKDSLAFDMLLPQFIQATGVSCVMDRGYPCEWVYSKVFQRNTNQAMLRAADEAFTKLGAYTIVLKRRSYEGSRPDDLVPQSKLVELDKGYEQFGRWTENIDRTIYMYVDDYENDLTKQIPALMRWLR